MLPVRMVIRYKIQLFVGMQSAIRESGGVLWGFSVFVFGVFCGDFFGGVAKV